MSDRSTREEPRIRVHPVPNRALRAPGPRTAPDGGTGAEDRDAALLKRPILWAASRLGAETRRVLDRRKRAASEQLDRTADAIRSAGTSYREDDDFRLGYYSDRAAGRISGAARYLRESPPAVLLEDLERALRRHPGLVLAGALTAGVLAGRLLRNTRS